MTPSDYEAYVTSRSRDDLDLNYAVIALNEEAGEVAGWYKKAVLRGNLIGLTDTDLLSELGDVSFYLTRIARLKGWTLQDVWEANRAKLDDRAGKGLRQLA